MAGERRTITVLVHWEGPDDSSAWKEALSRAVAARLARERNHLPDWEPAHPLDPDWLAANGHTWWVERSAPTGGSPFVKTLHYVNVDLQRVPAEGRF